VRLPANGPHVPAAGTVGRPRISTSAHRRAIARYAERTSRDLAAIDCYTVLACFTLGILLEGTHSRALTGQAPTAVGSRLHTMALQLFERAATHIAAS
jgi:hypothetical protein